MGDADSIVYRVAGPGDVQEICAVLRDNPMDGAYSIALLRDPDPFAAACNIAARHVFILARDAASGETVGVCERIVREAFVNGAPCLLPYLGALRVSRNYRGRIGVLRGGFHALRESAEHSEDAPFAFTSIAEGNRAAERILTAGLKGMPLYRRIGGYSTFAMRAATMRLDAHIHTANADLLPELAAFLNGRNSRFQFASVWSAARLRALGEFGLPPERIFLWIEGGDILGSLALWDQRAFRQTRILSYPPLIRALRPLARVVAPILGLPTPPPVGSVLDQAAVALVAAQDDDPNIFLSLLSAALNEARENGFAAATLGLASDHPWRSSLLRNRRALEYRSRIFAVHWPETQTAVDRLNQLPLGPELGFL